MFVSGTAWPMPVRDARNLAANPQLDGRLYAALSGDAREALLELLAQGHYTLLDNDAG